MATIQEKERSAQQSTSCELEQRFMGKSRTKILGFRNKQFLTDVTFKVSNPPSVVQAHRLILSAASPYFENLFNGEGGNNPVIDINDIDGDTFERLIAFCYTGQALITVDNVAATLKAALVLQLEEVTTACVDYLMGHISECTLKFAHALERETQCEFLKQKLREYELENFIQISQSDEFLNFDVGKLQYLLESDNLKVTREKDAFDAITRWFNYDVSARQEHLPLLVACLRLTEFGVDFLLTHVQSLPGCELLALNASMWIRDPAARTKINIRFTTPRRVETTLLAICSMDGKTCAMQYNKVESNWQVFDSLEKYTNDCCAVFKDNNILIFGGVDGGKASNKVFSWNIQTRTWVKLPHMNQARCNHSVVELDGTFYVIGGSAKDDTSLQSVERYTTSDGWDMVKPLNTGRQSASAVALNGKIYIMGGYNKTWLKSVECYNPDSNTWTSCANMTERIDTTKAAVHNGHIYIAYHKENTRIFERYNHERDTWSKIFSINVGELDWGSIVFASLDNKLWFIDHGSGCLHHTLITAYEEEIEHCTKKIKCLLDIKTIHSCFVVPTSLLTPK